MNLKVIIFLLTASFHFVPLERYARPQTRMNEKRYRRMRTCIPYWLLGLAVGASKRV